MPSFAFPSPNHNQSLALAFTSSLALFSIISLSSKLSKKAVEWSLPRWAEAVDYEKVYRTDEEAMKLAIYVSRKNMEMQTGGPFGERLTRGTGDSPGGWRGLQRRATKKRSQSACSLVYLPVSSFLAVKC